MKKSLLFAQLFASTLLVAQVSPINFESTGNGASWNWVAFENNTQTTIEFVANPSVAAPNTSATVVKFTAKQAGQPWAGCETPHGAGVGTFTLNASNCFVKILVWKPIISDVGIKFATPSGASTGEIKVPNTLINQWEELTFDFSGIIGLPSSSGIDQLIVFPDFLARSTDHICYFDNIRFGSSSLAIEESSATNQLIYPMPFQDEITLEALQIGSLITITDAAGNRVLEQQVDMETMTCATTDLLSGVYFVNYVATNGKLTVQKIIK